MRLGMQVEECDAERTVVTMPVEGNTQPYGLLHGGANAALLEQTASMAANAHARSLDDSMRAVGVSLSINHLRPVKAGRVKAIAEALHRGSRMATYTVSILDEDGALVASGQLSAAIIAPK